MCVNYCEVIECQLFVVFSNLVLLLIEQKLDPILIILRLRLLLRLQNTRRRLLKLVKLLVVWVT